MKNLRVFIAIAMVYGVAPSARSLPNDAFDQGVDLKAFGEQFHTDSIPNAPVSRASGIEATRDCQVVTFAPTAAPKSDPFTLTSVLYRRVCRRVEGKDVCEDELVKNIQRSVVLELKGKRQTLPWEKDVFSVCMQGTNNPGVDTLVASHKYGGTRVRATKEQVILELPVEHKIATAPDPAGIAVESFGPDAASSSLSLVLKDKWAAYYKGEKTVLHVRLKRDIKHWFDATLLEQTLTWPADLNGQDVYRIDFPEWLFLRDIPWTGKKYFVEWEFSRQGPTSLNDVQKQGQTARIELAKTPKPGKPDNNNPPSSPDPNPSDPNKKP